MTFAKPSEQAAGSDIERPDLGDVLEFYGVPSRKSMVACPLHDDRTPSFSVNYGKGLWNCHSCGSAGDAWTLIQLKEGVDFLGAKAFAEANNFKDVGGGASQPTYRSKYGGGRRAKPKDKGRKRSSGGYTPSWRRR